MSTRDARSSQSTFSSSFTKKQGENTSSQRPTKRPKEDLEETPPKIIVNRASTATITEEPIKRHQNFLTDSPITIHNTDELILKLNRLKEKSVRYVPNRYLISQCIDSKLVPKGLVLILEPTIGNYDQAFIDNWYSHLKGFSFVLMEQIVLFCDKAIQETAIKIKLTILSRF